VQRGQTDQEECDGEAIEEEDSKRSALQEHPESRRYLQ
jgi:hypothetical protein